MKDRVTAGFIAGVAAGIVMNIINYISYSINLTQELLLEWAAIMIYGRLPASVPEAIFAQFGQLVFSGFVGIIFAYMMLKLTSGNYLLKGWIYAVILWFTLYAISSLFKIPNLQRHTLETALTTFASGSVYGLMMAEMLRRLLKTKT